MAFEAVAVADQGGLEGWAITHFEGGGDSARKRMFDEFGVTDLFCGCEHLVQSFADRRKLRRRIRIPRARGSLADQGV